MAKIVTTAKKLRADLMTLAGRPNFYKNQYPYNLCYNYSDGQVSADCVNLYKALLNGYNVEDKTAGYYQSYLGNTGDVTEWGLMSQCTDVTTDFSRLIAEPYNPRLLYKEGHIGGFLGEAISINGNWYNVIECTVWKGDWNHTGIIYTWCDSNGVRRTHKGGETNGRWEYNGLMTPWVDYSDVQPQPEPEPEPEEEMFKDVTKKTSGYSAIKWCAENGLVKGFKDGTFRPNDSITRAGVCIIIYRLWKKFIKK